MTYASERAQARSGTLERVEEIVRDVLDDESLVLTPDLRPADVKGWDSLAHVSIVFCLEEAFGTQMDDALIEGFDTVGDLVAIIDRWA